MTDNLNYLGTEIFIADHTLGTQELWVAVDEPRVIQDQLDEIYGPDATPETNPYIVFHTDEGYRAYLDVRNLGYIMIRPKELTIDLSRGVGKTPPDEEDPGPGNMPRVPRPSSSGPSEGKKIVVHKNDTRALEHML
jgi:hypothetical protein